MDWHYVAMAEFSVGQEQRGVGGGYCDCSRPQKERATASKFARKCMTFCANLRPLECCVEHGDRLQVLAVGP